MVRDLKAGIVCVQTDIFGCNFKRKLEHIISSVNNENLDLIVAPEWYFYPGKPYNRKEKDNIVNELARECCNSSLILPGTFIWTEGNKLYNSVPIIANGKYHFDYHKKSDGGTSNIAADHGKEMQAGNDDKFIFSKWMGLEIGMEICSDHGLLYNSGIENLDMQILIACGMPLIDFYCQVKRYRYALCCDGLKPLKPKAMQKIDMDQPIFNPVLPLKIEKNLAVYSLQF